MSKVRLFGTAEDSIVDGPGLRFSIFTQGCVHACPGCHNLKSHSMDGGYEEDTEKLIKKIKENKLIDGVTFSGGEPFLQIEPLIEMAKEVKSLGLNIIIYTGYTYEQVLNNKNMLPLLELTDILIDGKFEQDKKSLRLMYRGSKNQRIIDVKKSLEQNKVIECEINEYGEIK